MTLPVEVDPPNCPFLKTKSGRIYHVQSGAVTCKRYVGVFENAALQAKADTKKWYTSIEANPHAIEGEGETPAAAAADAAARTTERIAQMSQAVATLRCHTPREKPPATTWSVVNDILAGLRESETDIVVDDYDVFHDEEGGLSLSTPDGKSFQVQVRMTSADDDEEE